MAGHTESGDRQESELLFTIQDDIQSVVANERVVCVTNSDPNKPNEDLCIYMYSTDEDVTLSTSLGESSVKSKSVLEPTMYDDTIYVGTGQELHAVSMDDGSHRWKNEEVLATCRPRIQNGVIYVRDDIVGSNGVAAVDPESGNTLWRSKIDEDVPRPTGPKEQQLLTPGITDDYVYLTSYEGHLYCFDSESGDEVWRKKASAGSFHRPHCSEGVVYISDSEGRLYTFDSETGDMRYTKESVGKIISVTPDGILVSSTDRYLSGARPLYSLSELRMVSESDGEQIWSSGISTRITTESVITEDEVYTRTQNGAVVINGGSGEIVDGYVAPRSSCRSIAKHGNHLYMALDDSVVSVVVDEPNDHRAGNEKRKSKPERLNFCRRCGKDLRGYNSADYPDYCRNCGAPLN